MTEPNFAGQQAERLRQRATALSGSERDYCLWLALEWDKTAARFETPLRRCALDGERRPAATSFE